MLHIKIDFPAGRWHATAWGTHVNEGIPEWPPCPWRLIRALIATWHWKHHRRDEDTLRAFVAKLASTPPQYQLPDAAPAHTRHYMPVVEGKAVKSVKIFDTFIHVNKGESLWIRWDTAPVLTATEHALLGELLAKLNYMGRAESLICATLDPAGKLPSDKKPWTTPLASDRPASVAADTEIIRLLAPQSAAAYSAWATTQNADVSTPSKTKKRVAATTRIPDTLFDALQSDTADWKQDGWNLPPGARWVEYARPRDSFKIAPAVLPRTRNETRPTVARFAVVGKVPPSITKAISLADSIHKSLCKILDGVNPDDHPDYDDDTETITGKDSHGNPLSDKRHTYILPECDPHGYVTHVTLYAPVGFGSAAVHVFGKLRKVWANDFEIKTVLLATGAVEDFEHIVPYFRKSRVWESLTPFYPVHHLKKKTDPKKNDLLIGSPAHDCWRLLEQIVPESDWFSASGSGTGSAGLRPAWSAAARPGSADILSAPETPSSSLASSTTPSSLLPVLRVAPIPPDPDFPDASPERIVHPHLLRTIPCLHFQRNRYDKKALPESTPGSTADSDSTSSAPLQPPRGHPRIRGVRAGDRGYALRIEFGEPVALPIGLGYGAHYGLGLFLPLEDPKTNNTH